MLGDMQGKQEPYLLYYFSSPMYSYLMSSIFMKFTPIIFNLKPLFPSMVIDLAVPFSPIKYAINHPFPNAFANELRTHASTALLPGLTLV